jgi:uncharacterized UBP type Zn finger protein
MSSPVKDDGALRRLGLRLLWTGSPRTRQCTHLDQVDQVTASSEVCEECVALGDAWVALRMCAVCGKTGCCQTSKNKHAHRHFEETGHPLIQSSPEDCTWLWCYVDKALLPASAASRLQEQPPVN